MNVFILLVIFGIKQIFSGDINFINQKPGTIFVKHDHTSVKTVNIINDESYLLSLVLKENIKNKEKCKKILEEHCKEFEKVFPGLKKVCKNDIDQKCDDLQKKNTVELICNEIETALKSESSIDEKCALFQMKCMFLGGACSNNFNMICNQLFISCYEKKREKTAVSVLLRALRSDLVSISACYSKIQEYCLSLNKESDELMSKCVSWKLACEELIRIGKKRNTLLKSEIKGIIEISSQKRSFSNNDVLRNKCHVLLPECHFYVLNYENGKEKNGESNEIKSLCNKLTNNCKSVNITYNPPSYSFNPMKENASLSEILDLQQLYSQVATTGVVVSKQVSSIDNNYRILALLIHNNTNVTEICKRVLSNNCSSVDYLDDNLKYKCWSHKQNSNDAVDCVIFPIKAKSICQNLNRDIKKHLSISEEDVSLGVNWHSFPLISSEVCVLLLSDCFFFEKVCEEKYLKKHLCGLLKVACYRQSRINASNSFFQHALLGNLHKTSESSESNCMTKLIEVCKNLKNPSTEAHIEMCLSLEKTCKELISSVQGKCEKLKKQLSRKSYQLTLKDCNSLEKECRKLVLDCPSLNTYCNPIYEKCELLNGISLLETHMLEEKSDHLKGQRFCKKRLDEMCDLWIKNNSLFQKPCKDKHGTCQAILTSINKYCYRFKSNIARHNFTLNVERISKSGQCKLWEPYCDMLKSNCISQNLKIYCQPLNDACTNYYKEQLRNVLIYELENCLVDESACIKCLSVYCNNFKLTKNDTLNSQCISVISDKGNGFCQNLISYRLKYCNDTLKELGEASEKIKSLNESFLSLKKEAFFASEKVTERDFFVLINTASTNNINTRLQHSLLYKTALQSIIKMLESEIVLEKQCIQFFQYCIFKDYCYNSEITNICQKNGILCHNLLISRKKWLFSQASFSASIYNNTSFIKTTEFSTVTKTVSVLHNFTYKIFDTLTHTVNMTYTKTLTHNNNITSIVTQTETEKVYIEGTQTIYKTSIITSEINYSHTNVSKTTGYWTSRVTETSVDNTLFLVKFWSEKVIFFVLIMFLAFIVFLFLIFA